MALSVTNLQQNNTPAVVEMALQEGEQSIQDALLLFQQSTIELSLEKFKQDYEESNKAQDKTILAQRGYRQLTNKEEQWYQKFIEASKSSNPKQEFTDLLSSPEGVMPVTIIEDVFKDLRENHPLLSKIKFQYTGYSTKWILNDHTKQTAQWGELNEEIVKEITSAFKVVDISQNKLSAFTAIPLDMLDLGPTFIDKYIRETLKEALALGFEKAIIDGTGKNQPIGLNRKISKGVSVSDGVYPKKEAISVKTFEMSEFGALLAKLAVNEAGRNKNFQGKTAAIICNQTDYLTKVEPALYTRNSAGEYVCVLKHPVETIISNEMQTGEAILCFPDEYFLGVGGDKEGVITYSDDFKFLEDKRYYKIKTFGDGKAYDNTTSLLLDITNLEPIYINVEVKAPKAKGK